VSEPARDSGATVYLIDRYREQARSYIYGYPLFCNTVSDVVFGLLSSILRKFSELSQGAAGVTISLVGTITPNTA
jgi:hypothetical protein